ncbi:MAG: rRNA cytosine-C5-methylase [Propionibacteriaceae bacterium]|nr:rRNA cytosine-C5-methylase [Propionibacteriaceae bacterium]
MAKHDGRKAAYRALLKVERDGAYANLELAKASAGLDHREAALATELVAGSCRAQGTFDRIITAASGRALNWFQPGVLVLLRMACQQLFLMRTPEHAAVDSTVKLARAELGQRVTGLVNAICRKIAKQELEDWIVQIAQDDADLLALSTFHPGWIVQAFADVLPSEELIPALEADNQPPRVMLALRPGLADFSEFSSCEAAKYSPYGVYADRTPGEITAVKDGRASVQDEGSQLVALALSRADAPPGPWLDMCAGPGGKSALLAGFADQNGDSFLAAELHEHRAKLVRDNLRLYRAPVIQADGTQPPWKPGSFSRVLADVPCSGLGALRRRPDARWRKSLDDIQELAGLQRALLNSALDALKPGGAAAYVTCSPHLDETVRVLESLERTDFEFERAASLLPNVPECSEGDYVQLWPHRHGTDAMFLAVLRKK